MFNKKKIKELENRIEVLESNQVKLKDAFDKEYQQAHPLVMGGERSK